MSLETTFERAVPQELYTESNAAKIYRVAQNLLARDNALDEYPETVPSAGPSAGHYQTRPVRFWTCGFFPGSIYCILERLQKFPRSLTVSSVNRARLHDQLFDLCRKWSRPLHTMAERTDTHDLGFIVQPALRMDWELTANQESLQCVIKAAYNLASRWSDKVGAIRSWDQAVSKAYEIVDMEKNFLVIVDSMSNLDLLFYVGHHTGDETLIQEAISHAQTVARTLVRDDYSTYHVANLDPASGEVQKQFTHQGYSDTSTWARGQAWAILGFTQTYIWTRNPDCLQIALGLSDTFLHRLSTSTQPCPFVPAWDFDAPDTDIRDTSAGMIAANGMLLLHQTLSTSPDPQGSLGRKYLDAALRILHDTIEFSLKSVPDHDAVRFVVQGADSSITTESSAAERDRFDAILAHSTANYNKNALIRYVDHGLVYADYYFLDLGNKLLRMGLV